MASNKKIERALNGPGPFEIILSILLSLVLGVLLAALHLVFKPVEVVKKAEEAVEVKNVYFVEGAVNSAKSRQWTRKRQMLTEGAAVDVVFNEEELNAWMATATPKPAAPAPGATPAQPAMIQPERINFRIQEGVLQVGLLGKLSAWAMSGSSSCRRAVPLPPGLRGLFLSLRNFTSDRCRRMRFPGLRIF